MKKLLAVLVIAIAVSLASSSVSLADSVPTVGLSTPSGTEPVQLGTVLPAVVGYESCPLGGCDATGTIKLSGVVSVTTDQDIPCGSSETINFDLVGFTPGSLGTAPITNGGDPSDPQCQPIPAGTTLDTYIFPPKLHHGFAGDYTDAQMAEMADGVALSVSEPDSSYSQLGMVTVASYAPVASVVGDPWFRFTSAFKAQSHLVVKTKLGRTVHRKALGWLKRGKHRVKFGCGRGHHGYFYVHIHGVAKDGAKQNSPVRRVRC